MSFGGVFVDDSLIEAARKLTVQPSTGSHGTTRITTARQGG